MRKNDVKKKQLIISGCLAGNTQSTAKVLAQEGKGFKRVFAFDEEIDFDKAIAIWSGFYYLLSPVGRMSVSEIRQTVKKLCECFDVKFLYFYPSRQKPEGVNVYNGKK